MINDDATPKCTACPACLGEGQHDFREMNALLGERLSDAQIAHFDLDLQTEFCQCEECDGTGLVTQERADDLAAGARAYMDQIIAKYDDDERRARA